MKKSHDGSICPDLECEQSSTAHERRIKANSQDSKKGENSSKDEKKGATAS